ncbi:MAG: ATP synthase F1 subunit delta [Candidatus Omnitrophota bacterium]|nr:MAG: ATP synthase F1 subunit delta [Candidatus Omnitrophota bacterium]
MKHSSIVLKYAQALALYGQKNRLLEKIKGDYETMRRLLWDNREARFYFLSSHVEREEKRALLAECKELLGLDGGFLYFLILLLEDNQFNAFSDIYEKFLDSYNVYANQLSVKVTTAFSLTDTEEKTLSKTLKDMFGKDLILEKEVDSKLYAGAEIFVESEDLKINLSVRSALGRLKEVLSQ